MGLTAFMCTSRPILSTDIKCARHPCWYRISPEIGTSYSPLALILECQYIYTCTHLRCYNCIPWFSTVSSYKHQKLKWKINSDKLQYRYRYNCYIHWVSNFQHADSEHTQACLQLFATKVHWYILLAGFCLSWIINLQFTIINVALTATTITAGGKMMFQLHWNVL